MIRVSDYIARRIVEAGVKHIFLITGGGAMHLNDAIGLNPDLEYVCNHHEQACAMAADGYARVSGNVAAVCVTTGPGGTNAVTGVLGQWLDSVPALYVSGQVRTQVMVASTGLPLRQLGDQEADIVSMVKTITKYAVLVTDPKSIRYHFDKALHLARSGRPGPVWLDVPLDVQSAMVDESELIPYDPSEDEIEFDHGLVERQVAEAVRRIHAAERPVILAGAGIRLGKAHEEFLQVVEKLGIPVLTAWDAIDLMATEHPLYFGRPSTLGQRAGNFIFQNADLLLSIGCRLNVRQIGYTFASVARAAYKIVVDIDPAELKKQTLVPDLPVHADARLFLQLMNRHLEGMEQPAASVPEWRAWCRARRERYPPVTLEAREEKGLVNPYVFADVLSERLDEGDVIVSSDGASCVVPIQAMVIKKGQRHIVNSGCAAMGFGLPAAVGACFAHGKRKTICLEGDGSVQLNIQELQTVVHHQLPLKIFIFNNGGYLSIRATQKGFFKENYVGESARSGVSFPDMVKLATAYGIPAYVITEHKGMAEVIDEVLQSPGPALCDVRMSPDQGFTPRVTSQRLPDGTMVSKPLEDMFPFLERDEFESNMIIPAWDSGS